MTKNAGAWDFVRSYRDGQPLILAGLCILSGLMLSSGWIEGVPGIILFVSFVPLLMVEERITACHRNHSLVFLYASLAFLTWNILTTWWIWNATPIGCVVAVLINTFLMSASFWLFHLTKRKAGNRTGYAVFILYWLGYEYLSLNTDLSWPWLNLGNGLASSPEMIQWYEYTGTLGGSLWILLVNLSIFSIILLTLRKKQHPFRSIAWFLLLTLIPVFISSLLLHKQNKKGSVTRSAEILVIQPNFDPYHDDRSNHERWQAIEDLASGQLTSRTTVMILPETTFRAVREHDWKNTRFYRSVMTFLDDHPGISIVAGAEYLSEENRGNQPNVSAANARDSLQRKYDSAILMRKGGETALYHKSKLVPGVEMIPWPRILGFLGRWAVRFGGISASLGTQEHRSVFPSADSSVIAAPVICYESVYGEHVTGFVRQGANILLVITNDGWWGDTPGYRQHLSYSRLRAIENRRSIARSANTGISCFIDPAGRIHQSTRWWAADAIRENLSLNHSLTVYARHGDYIGRLSAFLSVLFILLTISVSLRKNVKGSGGTEILAGAPENK